MQDKNQGGQNSGNQNKQNGLSWSAPQNQNNQQQKPQAHNNKPPMVVAATADKNAAKYAGMAVVGIIAGVLIAWGWVSWQGSPDTTAGGNMAISTATDSSTGGMGVGTNTGTTSAIGSSSSLTIASPQAAGTSVAVSKAVVTSPTWIVVYENKDGGPGNALGAALFFPGNQTGTVELLRGTTPGKTYLAVKQVDNGDRKFSLKDDQFLSEGGEVQWVSFETN